MKKELRQSLLPVLADLEDERAERAHSLLKKRVWDLDALVLLGVAPSRDGDALTKLASLRVPDEERVLQAETKLDACYEAFSRLAGTDIEEAERLVQLLGMALKHYRDHDGEACPVCGVGVLDTEWRTSIEKQVERLRETAGRYKSAKLRLRQAVDLTQRLVTVPTIPMTSAVDTTTLRDLWTRWTDLPDDPGEMSDHLLAFHERLTVEVARVVEQAEALYSRQEEQWADVFRDVMAWEKEARLAVASRELTKQIRKAEQATKEVAASLRATRWQPIEGKALRLWEQLRLGSNVDLRSVELAGARTRRHVDLTVEVDGTEAQALAVASQGEISCLALALFFPRATLAASPFRFLLIDDPIQSMDPARVDGLAQVLSEIAAYRQLIVLTHDDRLPESLRRLQLPHTCQQVVRQPGSVVEVKETLDPSRQHFWDARAVSRDDGLLAEVAENVVPGMCREGLEAACLDVIRRRRLGRGEPHADVEQLLEGARTLSQKAALALFDDVKRAGEVSGRISKEWGSNFTDAFWAANRGAHHGYRGDLASLINDCQGLAERIRVKS